MSIGIELYKDLLAHGVAADTAVEIAKEFAQRVDDLRRELDERRRREQFPPFKPSPAPGE